MLSVDEQALIALVRANLPQTVFHELPDELLAAAAKILGAARAQLKAWVGSAYLKTASGMWLDQHARDRATWRQSGESDAVLQARIRRVEDALTPQSLLSLVHALLAAAGISGATGLVSLPRDQAFAGACFATRGYRAGRSGRPHVLIVLLPLGTPPAIRNTIAAALRPKVAAGKTLRIEPGGAP